MERKTWIILCVLGVMLFGSAIRIYTTTNSITQNDLNNISSKEVAEKVSEVIIKNTGEENNLNYEKVESINVLYGKIKMDGKEKDAIISVKFKPGLTVVAVYEKKNGVYEHLSSLGTFYDIEKISLLSLKNMKNDIIAINENIDQRAGGLEVSSFLRLYHCDEYGNIDLVFNMPSSIQADWNTAWNEDNVDFNRWERVTQTSKIVLENGNYPKIKAERNQEYYVSNDQEAKIVPDSQTFEKQNERTVSEVYYWSDTYSHFIQGERKEKTTGQKVAVIERWGSLPYAFAESYDDYESMVRVLRKDGSIDVLSENVLEE